MSQWRLSRDCPQTGYLLRCIFLRLRVIRSRGFTRLVARLSEDRNAAVLYIYRAKFKKDCVSSSDDIGYAVAQLVGAQRYKSEGRGFVSCRFQFSSGLRCTSMAALLLGLRVRMPPRAWMFLLQRNE